MGLLKKLKSIMEINEIQVTEGRHSKESTEPRHATLKDFENINLKFQLSEPYYDANTKQSIMIAAKEDRKLIAKDFEEINILLGEACKHIGREDALYIDATKFKYDEDFEPREYSHFDCYPLTQTGKISKYPIVFKYAFRNHHDANPLKWYFGDIGYMQDSSIGKARLIFWNDHELRIVYLSMTGKTLSVSKVITKDLKGNDIILYKK